MTKIERFDQFLVSRNIKVVHKEESPFMKVLGVLLFFIPGFMADFATTIGNTIYIPKSLWGDIGVRCHEFTHVYDSRSDGVAWYSFKYLVPQILCLLSLGALTSIWFSQYFLLFLVCLVFLAPWHARYRRLYELRGYKMSVAVAAWEGLWVDVDWMAREYFDGPSYYYMGSKDVREILASTYELAKQGKPLGQPYDTVYCLLYAHDVNAVCTNCDQCG